MNFTKCSLLLPRGTGSRFTYSQITKKAKGINDTTTNYQLTNHMMNKWCFFLKPTSKNLLYYVLAFLYLPMSIKVKDLTAWQAIIFICIPSEIITLLKGSTIFINIFLNHQRIVPQSGGSGPMEFVIRKFSEMDTYFFFNVSAAIWNSALDAATPELGLKFFKNRSYLTFYFKL